MAQFTLPYLGVIDTDDLDERYDGKVVLTNDQFDIDLNMDEETIEVERLEVVKKFLEELEVQLIKNREYIAEEYQAPGDDPSVSFYLQIHKEQLGQENLCKRLGINSDTLDLDQQLIDHLKIVRVGLYPHDSNYFSIFDYSFGRNITNRVLVISTYENGDFHYMSVES